MEITKIISYHMECLENNACFRVSLISLPYDANTYLPISSPKKVGAYNCFSKCLTFVFVLTGDLPFFAGVTFSIGVGDGRELLLFSASLAARLGLASVSSSFAYDK